MNYEIFAYSKLFFAFNIKIVLMKNFTFRFEPLFIIHVKIILYFIYKYLKIFIIF